MADAVIAVGGVNDSKCHEVAALSGYIQCEQAQKCDLERCATSLSMILARDHSRILCVVEHAHPKDDFVVHIAISFQQEDPPQLVGKANVGILFEQDRHTMPPTVR